MPAARSACPVWRTSRSPDPKSRSTTRPRRPERDRRGDRVSGCWAGRDRHKATDCARNTSEGRRAQVESLTLRWGQAMRNRRFDLFDQFLGGRKQAPQPCRVVPGAGQDALAVGREGDSRDDGRVTLERRDLLARGRVPQPCRIVRGAGQDALAVGREGDSRDFGRVALESRDSLARGGVPQPCRVVIGAGQDALAVGREGDSRDGGRNARSGLVGVGRKISWRSQMGAARPTGMRLGLTRARAAHSAARSAASRRPRRGSASPQF